MKRAIRLYRAGDNGLQFTRHPLRIAGTPRHAEVEKRGRFWEIRLIVAATGRVDRLTRRTYKGCREALQGLVDGTLNLVEEVE